MAAKYCFPFRALERRRDELPIGKAFGKTLCDERIQRVLAYLMPKSSRARMDQDISLPFLHIPSRGNLRQEDLLHLADLDKVVARADGAELVLPAQKAREEIACISAPSISHCSPYARDPGQTRIPARSDHLAPLGQQLFVILLLQRFSLVSFTHARRDQLKDFGEQRRFCFFCQLGKADGHESSRTPQLIS